MCITETGHPSSTSIGSSLDLQKNFIDNLNQVALTNENRILFIRYNFINDPNAIDALNISVNTFSVFGTITQSSPIVEFFKSMGLRTESAGEKPAWCVYKDINYGKSLGASTPINSSYCFAVLFPAPTSEDLSVGEIAGWAIFFFSISLLLILLFLIFAPGELMKLCKPYSDRPHSVQ